MQDSLLQLKPANESFLRMARGIKKRFTAVIICEGSRDAEVLKAVIRKLGIGFKGIVAVTHGEGIPSIYELLLYVVVLARLSRKLRALGLVIDSESMKPTERLESIVNSLRSRLGLGVNILEEDVDDQFYHLEIVLENRTIPLLVAINGIHSMKFERHMIEEHLLLLKLLEGKIRQEDIGLFKDPKQAFTDDSEIINLIQSSREENIHKAFKHFVKLILKLRTIETH